jgi:hypothetical protein
MEAGAGIQPGPPTERPRPARLIAVLAAAILLGVGAAGRE